MNTTNQRAKSQSRTIYRSAASLTSQTAQAAAKLGESSNATDTQLTRRAKSDPDNLPLNDGDFKSGAVQIVRRQPKPNKVSLTIRLDEDLIDWFKSQGQSGYQTRINEALRAYRVQVETGSNNPSESLDKIESLVRHLRHQVA